MGVARVTCSDKAGVNPIPAIELFSFAISEAILETLSILLLLEDESPATLLSLKTRDSKDSIFLIFNNCINLGLSMTPFININRASDSLYLEKEGGSWLMT